MKDRVVFFRRSGLTRDGGSMTTMGELLHHRCQNRRSQFSHEWILFQIESCVSSQGAVCGCQWLRWPSLSVERRYNCTSTNLKPSKLWVSDVMQTAFKPLHTRQDLIRAPRRPQYFKFLSMLKRLRTTWRPELLYPGCSSQTSRTSRTSGTLSSSTFWKITYNSALTGVMKKRSVQSGVSNLYTFWTSKILGRFFDEVESLAPTPEICPSDGSHFIYGPINAGRWDGEVIMSYIQLATSSLEEPISQPFAGKNRF